MTVPTQVLAAGAAADAAIAAREAQFNPVVETVEPEAQAQPAEPTTQLGPVATTPTPAKEDWESKYNTLQGKYNAEVPALRQSNQQLSDAVSGLTARVDQLISAPKQEAPAPDLTVAPALSEKDKDEFGADLVAMVARISNEAATAACARMEKVFQQEAKLIHSKLDNTQHTVGQTQLASFAEKVSAQVPEFNTRNGDAKFIAWLDNERESFSNATYGELLQKAAVDQDVPRVVRIFETYWGSSNAPAQAEAAPVVSAANSLASEVAPAAARGTATPQTTGNAPKIWTTSMVTKFYADQQRGLYKGKPQEVEVIEADIFAAQREGRFRS